MMKILKKVIDFYKKHKHIVNTTIVFMVCIVFFAGIYLKDIRQIAQQPYVAVSNTISEIPLGEMLPRSEVKQTFIGTTDNIEGISIQLAADQPITPVTVEVQIIDVETNQKITQEQLVLTDSPENKFYQFIFEQPLIDMLGRQYAITITSPDGATGNAITTWASKQDAYGSGILSIDGVQQDGDLCFQLLSEKNSFINVIYLIGSILASAFFVLLYLFIFVIKRKTEKIFMLCALFVGVAYMFVMTPNVVPDEPAHIQTAYRLSNAMMLQEHTLENGNMMMRSEDIYTGFTTDPSISTYKNVYQNLFKMESDPTLHETGGRNVGNPVQYVPAAIGITIARWLHLGSVPLLFLGRLANLLFFVFCSYFAIKKIPFGKMVLFTVCLLPMTMQQAASFSYDALINGLAFLFIAYCLYIAYSKEKIAIKDLVILCIAGALLATHKAGVYIVLCFLCLIIPKTRFKTVKAKYFVIGCVLATAMLAMLAINLPALLATATTESNAADNFLSWCNKPAYTLSFIFENPKDFIYVLVNSFDFYGTHYMKSMIGLLGWLNISIHSLYIHGFAFLMILSGIKTQDEKQYIKVGHKLWMSCIVIGGVLLIMLAMFTGWTPAGSAIIEGVQGRYLLPMLPLAILLLRNSNLTFRKNIDNPIIFGVCILQMLTVLEIFINSIV